MFVRILLGLAIIVVALFGAGFGLCGALGVVYGLGSLPHSFLPLFLGAVGLAVAAAAAFLIRWLSGKLFRSRQ